MKIVKEFIKSIIESMGDGYGFNLVIFLQGCIHHCEGCQNPTTWNVDKGVHYSVDELFLLLQDKIEEGGYDGITFSGGDPLYQHEELNLLVLKLKEKNPKLNITVYTGYTFEDVQHLPVIKSIDYLIDGKFDKELAKMPPKFRGSSNQRLIHLKNGQVTKIE